MREVAERQQSAEQREQASERMRQASRRLAGRNEKQRDRWVGESTRDEQSIADAEGGANAGRTPSDSPSNQSAGHTPNAESEPVDLTGAEPGDQTLAEWLSDENVDPENLPTGDSSSASQRAERARQVAERAVNDSVVHRRYHPLIKKYFGRLPETVESAAAGRQSSSSSSSSSSAESGGDTDS